MTRRLRHCVVLVLLVLLSCARRPPALSAAELEAEGYKWATGAGRAKDSQLGCELFEQACELGDVKGCHNHGYCLQEGLGGATDVARARAVYDAGCKRDFADSCYALGLLLTRGQGGPRDELAAFRSFEHGCRLGDGDSCTSVAKRFALGEIFPRDRRRAVHYYTLGCTLGDVVGCKASIANLTLLGDSESLRQAFELASSRCNTKHVDTCADLAELYVDGDGVPVDLRRAAELYRRACDGGHGDACHHLASILDDYSLDEAREALVQGCELDDDVSCIRLARLVLLREEPDAGSALRSLVSACDAWLQDGLACDVLGDVYRWGYGVPRDLARARELYESACTRGSLYACGGVGGLLLVLRQELPRARKLLSSACGEDERAWCSQYGFMLEEGLGGPASDRAALEAYLLGCAEHRTFACTNAAKLVLRKLHAPSDVKRLEEVLDLACRQRSGDACTAIGYLGMKRIGKERQPAEIVALFEASCGLEAPKGCTALGEALWRDFPEHRSLERAREALEKGCRLGDGIGCFAFASMHDPYVADRIRTDPTVAVQGYQEACDEDIAEACEWLGRIHAQGLLEQPKDVAAAKRFFTRACELGMTQACAPR